jgi:hypothetical protein
MNFGDLEVWIDFSLDVGDFVLSNQEIEKCAEAGMH